jgi:Tfp pilus assembly protein PilF
MARLKVAVVLLTALVVMAGSAAPAMAIDVILAPPKATTPGEISFREGIAALEKNDLATAEKAFKESVKHDSKAAGPYMGLAMVALRQGKKDVAEQNMKTAVSLAPNSASIQTTWGTYLYTQRDLPAAEAALRKAISLDSNVMAAHLHLGDMYLVAFRKPDEAIKEYRAAIAAAPSHAGAHYALALAYLSKGNDAQGEAELLQAVKLAPSNPLPHHVLGRLYASHKQYDRALQAFDGAIKALPAFPAAHFERGQVLAAKGDDAGALKAYAEAQRHDPKKAIGITNVAMVHQRNERWAPAEEAYLSAIKIEPRNAIAYNNLAWMAADRKTDTTRALGWAKKAVSLEPAVPEFQVTLGWTYRASGDLAKAAETLRAAAAMKPQTGTAHHYLGRVYLEQGKKSEAAAAFKRALALEPSFAEAQKYLKELGQK